VVEWPPSEEEGEGYLDQSTAGTKATHRKAERFFAAGQRANEIGDAYGQATVILALALFMGSITQAFDTRRIRILLLSLAGFCTSLGVVRIIGLPAIRLHQPWLFSTDRKVCHDLGSALQPLDQEMPAQTFNTVAHPLQT